MYRLGHPPVGSALPHAATALAKMPAMSLVTGNTVVTGRRPFATDRRGEVPAGRKGWYTTPVFHWYAGQLSVIYGNRYYIESAQRFPDAPRLTEKQTAALDLFDSLANDPSNYLDIEFKPAIDNVLAVGEVDFFQSNDALSAARWLRDLKAERLARRDRFFDQLHALDLLELAHRLAGF